MLEPVADDNALNSRQETANSAARMDSRATRIGILTAIVLLGLTLRLTIFFLGSYPQQPPFQSDSGTYFGYAERIAAGEMHAHGEAGVPPPESLPPLYPLFLAGFIATVGYHPCLVIGVQILLSVLLIYVTYRLSRLYLPTSASMLSAGIVAMSPQLAGMSNVLLTEALYIPLLGMAGLLFCTAIERQSVLFALAAGVACAAASLTRSVALLLPAALVIAALLQLRNRAGVKLALTTVAGCALLMLPWSAYKRVAFPPAEFPKSSTSGHAGLFLDHAAHMASHGLMARPNQIRHFYSSEKEHEEAQARFIREIWEPRHTPGYRPPVTAKYFLSHPWDYVRQTFFRAVIFLEPDSAGGVFGIKASFGQCLAKGRVGLLAFKGLLLLFDIILLAGAFAGAVIGLRDWKRLLPVYAIMGYFLSIHIFFYCSVVRYRYPLVPFLAFFVALLCCRTRGWLCGKRDRCFQNSENSM